MKQSDSLQGGISAMNYSVPIPRPRQNFKIFMDNMMKTENGDIKCDRFQE